MIRLIISVLFFLIVISAKSQNVFYAEPSRAQMHDLNEIEIKKYEIIGKFGDNVMIYKRLRDNNVMCIYDAEMKEVSQVAMDFLPLNVLNYEFIAYKDFCWMIFNFKKDERVYCMAMKLGIDGKKIGKAIQLDVIENVKKENIKFYGIIKSEDKQKILLLKGSAKNKNEYLIKTLLVDNNLKLLHSSELVFPQNDQNEIINEFAVDNEGNFVFGKSVKSKDNNNAYAQFYLQLKPATEDFFIADTIKLNGVELDEVKLKVDDFNKKYVLTSLCYKANKNDVSGIFYSVWDFGNKEMANNYISIDTIFNEKTKEEVKIKSNFNTFYLQNITSVLNTKI